VLVYAAAHSNARHKGANPENPMNPLDKITGTIVAGVVLAILAVFAVKGLATEPAAVGNLMQVLDRWVHIVSGITWIGLLYYFNFVQVPALAEAGADKGGPGGAGVTKYVVPRALLWFRWAALVTWLSGAYYLMITPHLGFLDAFTLGLMQGGSAQDTIIGIGAWLGTIMLFNVWVLIWPNQQKILGLKPATDEEKARGRRVAFLASRTNTMLSLPMLLCMAASAHGLPF
jgi:uncharacterized membrane protein